MAVAITAINPTMSDTRHTLLLQDVRTVDAKDTKFLSHLLTTTGQTFPKLSVRHIFHLLPKGQLPPVGQQDFAKYQRARTHGR